MDVMQAKAAAAAAAAAGADRYLNPIKKTHQKRVISGLIKKCVSDSHVSRDVKA